MTHHVTAAAVAKCFSVPNTSRNNDDVVVVVVVLAFSVLQISSTIVLQSHLSLISKAEFPTSYIPPLSPTIIIAHTNNYTT